MDKIDDADAVASKEVVGGAVAVINQTAAVAAAAAAVEKEEALAVGSEISRSIDDRPVGSATADDIEYYHTAVGVAAVGAVMDTDSHKSALNRGSHQMLIKSLSKRHSVGPCSTP